MERVSNLQWARLHHLHLSVAAKGNAQYDAEPQFDGEPSEQKETKALLQHKRRSNKDYEATGKRRFVDVQ
jgi:hypothetical protein